MFHDQVLAHCKQAGFEPNITFTTSQWDLLLEMTAEDQGITLIGRPLVEKLYSDRIKCISLKNPEFPWTLGLIRKKCKPLQEAAKSFGTFVVKTRFYGWGKTSVEKERRKYASGVQVKLRLEAGRYSGR